jgi:hypothetical protein
MKHKLQFIDPKLVKLNDRFKHAFTIDKITLQAITDNMKLKGYDRSQPVKLWSKTLELIDGHTRRQAAIQAGLIRIPYIIIDLAEEISVINYINDLQFNRRNLTDIDRIKLLQSCPALNTAKNKKIFISEYLKVSERTAARYMAILKDPEKLEAVLNDNETINHMTTKPKIISESQFVTQATKLINIIPDKLSEDEKTVLSILFKQSEKCY